MLRILEDNRESIERRLNARVKVERVLVRQLDRARQAHVAPELLTTRWEEVVEAPNVSVVVELIGGIEPARSHILAALRAGKHVVTANKALIAAHGKEIFAEAAARGCSVYFEGSVAGGIPILRSLREGLASDEIEGLIGILNGTSNFVLDAMTREGVSYEDAVLAAQRAGYAEADPTLDVDGHDAAQKLAILALVSFGIRVDAKTIPTEGIRRVRPFDIECARELGCVIKSLAFAGLSEEGLCLRVHPTLVPQGHVLAGVHGPYNAVLVRSRAMGRSLYYGQGAGMMPTGMAVVSDIIEVCRNHRALSSAAPPPEAFSRIHEASITPMGERVYENYLCVHVPNVPGVLGRVASCLGRHGVSIKRMNQDTPGPGEIIEMVIITELVEEERIQAAIAELDALDAITIPTDRIRFLEPHLEEP